MLWYIRVAQDLNVFGILKFQDSFSLSWFSTKLIFTNLGHRKAGTLKGSELVDYFTKNLEEMKENLYVSNKTKRPKEDVKVQRHSLVAFIHLWQVYVEFIKWTVLRLSSLLLRSFCKNYEGWIAKISNDKQLVLVKLHLISYKKK